MKSPDFVKALDQIRAEIEQLERQIRGDEATKELATSFKRVSPFTDARLKARRQKLRELREELKRLELEAQ
jgi:hypothetical protein